MRFHLIVSLLVILTACSGNEAVEHLFQATPKPQKTPETINSSTKTNQNPQLPPDFPTAIPPYPEAKFLSTNQESEGWIETIWQSTNSREAIISYYQDILPARNWQIQKSDNSNFALEASQENIQLKLSFPLSLGETSGKIKFALQYRQQENKPKTPITTITPTNNPPVAEIYSSYLEDLAALGIIPSASEWQDNQTISRREYANWLVTANNRIYQDIPSKQIRLAPSTDTPVFQDVSSNDPDFPQIQGLAEAGLIPSSLTGDTSARLFRPDAPLTRETLILWKAPLDSRKALPPADIDLIKQTWGFQDSAQIQPKALSSFYADYQNGERAMVRRVFGYTTLLQPQKPVTPIEAAVALWYFGNLAEGRSAAQALQLQN